MSNKNEAIEYLFVGGLFPKDHEAEIIANSIGAMQNAANVLQWNFINGFDKNLEQPITILNAVYIGSYPKRYKEMNIRPYSFAHTPGANDYEIGFCNLPLYKHYSRAKSVNAFLKKWLKERADKKCVIFGYAMTSFIVSAMEYAKKHHKNTTTCLIVPDLPEYMSLGRKLPFWYRALKAANMERLEAKRKFVDKYVLLTDQMHDYLHVDDYIVVEGIASDGYEGIQKNAEEEKIILYAGGLNQKYGIVDLVDAFMLTTAPNYRLVLCGAGDSKAYIEQAAAKDPRIKFMGQIPRSEVLKLQLSATVLVNPRKNNEEFTKYSFPSKNLEYLSSGTVLVGYKLDGIPDDYNGYIQYVQDDSNRALADKLIEVCEMDEQERAALGQRAKEFVLTQKNAEKQVARVLQFVKGDSV